MEQKVQYRTRLDVLDIMQGLAMMLVILGHHLLDFMPSVYGDIHYYIYTFHMPLFIFISSFLISYSYKDNIKYIEYIKRRFIKFFVPYLIIGMFVTVLYYFLYDEQILQNLINLLVSPKESATTFLWYIYLLFFFYVIYPPINKALNSNIIYFVFIVAIILNICPLKTPIFCLDYLTKYFIFYIWGCFSAKHYNILSYGTSKIMCSIMSVLFVLVSISVFYSREWHRYSLYIIPFLSIPTAYIIALLCEKMSLIKKILITISKECFHIYLIHMFVIQGLAIIVRRLWQRQLTNIEMIFYMLASTILSIIVSIYFFRILNKSVNYLRK